MKIVVIGGTRKSGTTLLHSLFDGHSQIISPPHDLNVFYAFYPRWTNGGFTKKEQMQRLYKVTVLAWLEKYKIYQDNNRYLKTKNKLNNFFNKNFKKYDFNNLENLFEFTLKLAISPFEIKQKKIIVLKETSFEFHLLNLRKKIIFIKLSRDPRDILSALKPGLKNKYKKIGEDFYDLLFSTFIRYSLSIKAFELLKYKKNILAKEIRFEDLVFKTKKTLRDISKFIGIKFDQKLLIPSMLGKKFTGNNLDNKKFSQISEKNIGKWDKRLDKKTIMYLEILLKNEIKKNKYKIKNTKNNFSLGEIYAKLNDKYFFKDRYDKY